MWHNYIYICLIYRTKWKATELSKRLKFGRTITFRSYFLENMLVWLYHMNITESQFTGNLSVYSAVCSDRHQRKKSKLYITCHLWWESNRDWWIPLTKSNIVEKVSHDFFLNKAVTVTLVIRRFLVKWEATATINVHLVVHYVRIDQPKCQGSTWNNFPNTKLAWGSNKQHNTMLGV